MPIIIFSDAQWMRQKPSGDNKHTEFNYVIGCNLVKGEQKDSQKSLQLMPSLADIWQPSVASDTLQQPAWLLERTTARAKQGWSWRLHVWTEAPLLGPEQGHCKLPKHKAPLCVTSATVFAKQSVKSRIMSGSTSESVSISLCDVIRQILIMCQGQISDGFISH